MARCKCWSELVVGSSMVHLGFELEKAKCKVEFGEPVVWGSSVRMSSSAAIESLRAWLKLSYFVFGKEIRWKQEQYIVYELGFQVRLACTRQCYEFMSQATQRARSGDLTLQSIRSERQIRRSRIRIRHATKTNLSGARSKMSLTRREHK